MSSLDTISFLLLELVLAWKDLCSHPVDSSAVCFYCFISSAFSAKRGEEGREGADLQQLLCLACELQGHGGVGGLQQEPGVGKALGFKMTTTTSSNLVVIPWASEKIHLFWQLKKWFMKAEAIKSI